MKPLYYLLIAAFAILVLVLLYFIPECRAENFSVDALVSSIICIESGWDANAVSPKGCIGLGQISNIVLREFNDYNYKNLLTCYENGFLATASPYDWQKLSYTKKDLLNPQVNIHITKWYLSRLKNHYLKDIIVFDNPFKLNEICVIDDKKIIVYKFKHSKGIKNAKDYKLALILASYNWGIGNVEKVNYDYKRFPVSVKTYIKKVLDIYYGR